MWNFDPFLCLVTDRSFRPEAEFLPAVEAAVSAGVTWVQFREKAGLSDRKTYELGLELRRITRRLGVPLVVDDRLDLAMALDADGVHVGQNDLPLGVLKKLWGGDKLWGVSVSTRQEAEEALAAGAAYVGVGALFPTGSKSDAVVLPPGRLADLKGVGLPLIGIGGITADRARVLKKEGLDGVAVISAILGAPDPAQAVRDFRAAWNLS